MYEWWKMRENEEVCLCAYVCESERMEAIERMRVGGK